MYNSRPQRVKEQSGGAKIWKCAFAFQNVISLRPGESSSVLQSCNKMQFKQPEPLNCDISWVPAWINMRKSQRASKHSLAAFIVHVYWEACSKRLSRAKAEKLVFQPPPHHRCAGERSLFSFHATYRSNGLTRIDTHKTLKSTLLRKQCLFPRFIGNYRLGQWEIDSLNDHCLDSHNANNERNLSAGALLFVHLEFLNRDKLSKSNPMLFARRLIFETIHM